MHRHVRRLALLGTASLAGVVLTACGGDTTTSTDSGGAPSPATTASATATPNAADVAFAQQMIPHHQQAIAMAEMAAEQASTPEVKALAERIKAAQDPEIATMTKWLQSWNKELPAGDAGHGMGMMSEQDMAKLTAARGPDFDRMFLTMMVEHHKGAIEMARAGQEKGSVPAVKQLAGAVVSAQQAEITEMQQLLTRL